MEDIQNKAHQDELNKGRGQQISSEESVHSHNFAVCDICGKIFDIRKGGTKTNLSTFCNDCK